MNRLIMWLREKFFSGEETSTPDQPRDSGNIGLDSDQKAEKSLGAKVVRWMNTQEPQQEPKEIPIPDIYSKEHVETVRDLKIFDPDSSEADISSGFDPYDTAKFHKK